MKWKPTELKTTGSSPYKSLLFVHLSTTSWLEAIEFLKNHTLLYIPIASCEPKGKKIHWKLINSARVPKMNTNERRVVVAVDESEESMHALSWCLNNLFSHDTNNTLVLLYVKPPLPVHSSFDAAGQNSHFLRSICPLQTLDLSMFYCCFILLDMICSWVMMTSHSTKDPSSRRIYVLKWCHQGRREIRYWVREFGDESSWGCVQELPKQCKPLLIYHQHPCIVSFFQFVTDDFFTFIFSFLQIHVERVVGCGDAKDVICGTVEKLEADTLVMGSHGYGFIKRYKQLILAALSFQLLPTSLPSRLFEE